MTDKTFQLVRNVFSFQIELKASPLKSKSRLNQSQDMSSSFFLPTFEFLNSFFLMVFAIKMILGNTYELLNLLEFYNSDSVRKRLLISKDI